MAAPDLSPILEEISKCSNCGLCQTACPVYRVTGRELGAARGRNQVLKALAQGEIEWSEDLHPVLFQCLGCRACMDHCFPAIPTHEVVSRARALYKDKVGGSDILEIFFNNILPYPSRMDALVKAASLGQRTGLARLTPALKVFGWYSKSAMALARSQELVPQFPKKNLRSRLTKKAASGKIAYFIGCGMNYMWPEAGEATIKLLGNFSEEALILDNLCCGLPPYSYGHSVSARLLARRNIELILESGADEVITDCASCSSFLKDYPKLFEHDPGFKEEAKEAASKIRDFSEWISEKDLPESGERLTVTFHDPCHLSRYQGLKEKPRKILGGIPNLEYREMKEADWCCGGAGAYNVSQHELSMKVLERKMNNIRETGADVLVTECPSCMAQLLFGLKKHKLDQIKLLHLSELLVSLLK